MTTLVTSSGTQVTLDRKLAQGGEGAVFTLNDPKKLAKIYHNLPSDQTVQKLNAMCGMANQPLLDISAWPTGVLCDPKSRRVVGFLMPRLNDCQPIQQLYNPIQRLKCFPRASWSFQLRAAWNLSAAFEAMHASGCVVGDVNQSNVIVSSHKDTLAMVWLIDCDSFQIAAKGKQFLCEVGVVHYTPPELQGKSFRGVVRSENHDRFGLAVLIYQLLFAGRHPYQGLHKDDASFEQLIQGFRFAQGPHARSWGMEPPPHTPTFEDIPPEIGNLFRKAFEKGSEANGRPKATEWKNSLRKLEQEITACKTDPGHKYWKGAKGCTWCRLAQKGGPEYYFGVGGTATTFTVDEAKLQEIMKRLSAAQVIESQCDLNQYIPQTKSLGKPLPTYISKLKTDWQQAEHSLQKLRQERQVAEARELQEATVRAKQQYKEIEDSFRESDDELEEEYEAEIQELKNHKSGRGMMSNILIGVIVLGGLLLPMGVIHRTFSFIGLMVMIVFGIWLGIYLATSPVAQIKRRMSRINRMRNQARWDADREIENAKRGIGRAQEASKQRTKEICKNQEQAVAEAKAAFMQRVQFEATERQKRYDEAETAIWTLKSAWEEQSMNYRRTYEGITSSVRTLISECRELGTSYQSDLKVLTAKAEFEAHRRHMRLNLIADADIDQIKDRRKETLANNGITTAEDIDETRIRAIDGFGPVYTKNLLAWKNKVSKEFHFDPKSAISSVELQNVTVKFRTIQQRILNDAFQKLSALDSLRPTYLSEIQRIIPKLQSAILSREQARADLAVIK